MVRLMPCCVMPCCVSITETRQLMLLRDIIVAYSVDSQGTKYTTFVTLNPAVIAKSYEKFKTIKWHSSEL